MFLPTIGGPPPIVSLPSTWSRHVLFLHALFSFQAILALAFRLSSLHAGVMPTWRKRGRLVWLLVSVRRVSSEYR